MALIGGFGLCVLISLGECLGVVSDRSCDLLGIRLDGESRGAWSSSSRMVWIGFHPTADMGMGELIVLLLNKRKRAIHDFIAGTVVIKMEFSEQIGRRNE